MKAHDLDGVLGGLDEMEFRELDGFNQGSVGVFWGNDGVSPWERHPEDDEFLQILAGEVLLTVLTDDGPVDTLLGPGSACVVPRGLWHRQTLRGTVRELYVTPGVTEHSMAEDPREDG